MLWNSAQNVGFGNKCAVGAVFAPQSTPPQQIFDYLMYRVFPLIAVLVLIGCSPEPVSTGPPDSWTGATGLWWIAGVDTATAFRNMDTLREMGVNGSDPVFVTTRARGTSGDQNVLSAKQSIIQLYRNEPEVVDSLFQLLMEKKIRDARPTGDYEETIKNWKKTAYKSIRRHFHEPSTSLVLGEDVLVTYPDSLRDAGVSGRVSMQVYVNEIGEPQSVKLLTPVHPLLDDIAMRAATEMRWYPAYLLRGSKSYPLNSWARFSIRFAQGTS